MRTQTIKEHFQTRMSKSTHSAEPIAVLDTLGAVSQKRTEATDLLGTELSKSPDWIQKGAKILFKCQGEKRSQIGKKKRPIRATREFGCSKVLPEADN